MKKKPDPEVLYEDNHLLIINKPAGYLVQEEPGDERDSVERWAKGYIKIKYEKPGDVFLGVVHRIDTPVSGVVILARTSKALERMNKLFHDRNIEKTYWALVQKAPPETAAKLEHFLTKNPKINRSTAHEKPVKDSQHAVLNFKTLARLGDSYLLEIDLQTGRPHQIRAQMAAIGCPVAGDKKYGFDKKVPGKGIYLHAQRIKFIHPVKKESMNIKAPLPGYQLWQQFEHLT
jgi:23S rRNA pseudouridine1911/1915/1917 synthase